MTPDPELNKQLTDDIAVQGATESEQPSTAAEGSAGTDSDDAAEMEEAQEEAAEERKEGGYQ
ncbi:hypothetical protein PQ455_13730 [Sphingomonas naphthae]|uniref:Uncharacterized protein n=1 Tax=Sphingomonas naphthae TaxID=1813468 RepID=A0ABY7TIY1_9SPHN|nr:hypothetical protein [Sphingomonas naphthae]WCT72687.1 hypothetical protein PQ455_13730 [Sphingomonas naphthae]